MRGPGFAISVSTDHFTLESVHTTAQRPSYASFYGKLCCFRSKYTALFLRESTSLAIKIGGNLSISDSVNRL